MALVQAPILFLSQGATLGKTPRLSHDMASVMLVSIFLQVKKGAPGSSSFFLGPWQASSGAQVNMNHLLGLKKRTVKPLLEFDGGDRCIHFGEFFRQVSAFEVQHAIGQWVVL